MANISIDNLADTINGALTQYNKEVVIGVKKQINSFTSDLVKNTKATAPVSDKRTQHYRDSITQKKLIETDSKLVKLWYVKAPDHRLSHLLNNGHAKKGGGRVEGTHFINKAYDLLEPFYIGAIEEVLKNAGN